MEHEKRISSRFSLQLPITVVLPETGLRVEGKTRDISASGIFLYADLPLAESIARACEQVLEDKGADAVWLPLGVGGHVDHRIVQLRFSECVVQ